MILIELFLLFFQIGLFTFGGGYAMIPMIRQEVVQRGFLTAIEVDQFIGIAESTPGPFAINIATFVGYNEGGVLGSILATLGVVLPSFIIILLIAYFSAKVLKTKVARSILNWINPLTIGLILAAGISVFVSTVLKDYPWNPGFNVDYIGLVIFGIIFIISILFKKINPIVLVIISGILGLILYQLF